MISPIGSARRGSTPKMRQSIKTDSAVTVPSSKAMVTCLLTKVETTLVIFLVTMRASVIARMSVSLASLASFLDFLAPRAVQTELTNLGPSRRKNKVRTKVMTALPTMPPTVVIPEITPVPNELSIFLDKSSMLLTISPERFSMPKERPILLSPERLAFWTVSGRVERNLVNSVMITGAIAAKMPAMTSKTIM